MLKIQTPQIITVERISYNKMSCADLKKILNERKINRRSNLTKKEEMVKVIEFNDKYPHDKTGLENMITDLTLVKKSKSEPRVNNHEEVISNNSGKGIGKDGATRHKKSKEEKATKSKSKSSLKAEIVSAPSEKKDVSLKFDNEKKDIKLYVKKVKSSRSSQEQTPEPDDGEETEAEDPEVIERKRLEIKEKNKKSKAQDDGEETEEDLESFELKRKQPLNIARDWFAKEPEEEPEEDSLDCLCEGLITMIKTLQMTAKNNSDKQYKSNLATVISRMLDNEELEQFL
jgi:hypothetical protein